MERTIGLDAHAASCTLAVISQTGRRLEDFPVETNGQALVEAIRLIPGLECAFRSIVNTSIGIVNA